MHMEINDFISDDDIPLYAILSHTWAKEEVKFHDWQNSASAEVSVKKGYEKIRHCCQQAVDDGLEWVWIDTCCIDKSSSAELSEAINSMFRWYQNANVCYVYLTDVPSCVESSEIHDRMTDSLWFTRGWTLQELLAPADIIFYSRNWKSLGTKSELLGVVSSITGIEEDFLQGKELEYASISKRMSWAAKRNTSRVEDIAYCLFGIFDVNMPLIYGEGKKSFQRLQQELIKTYPYDHTLYAWGVLVDEPSIQVPNAGELPSWNQSDARRRLLGPLAISPRDFEFAGSFLPYTYVKNLYHDPRFGPARLPIPLGLGVQFELPVFSYASAYHWSQVKITQRRNLYIAVLLCLFAKNSALLIGIPLQPCGDSSWGRTSEIILNHHRYYGHLSFRDMMQSVFVEAERLLLLENGDIIIRRQEYLTELIARCRILSNAYWTAGANVIRETSTAQFYFCLYFEPKEIGDSPLRGLAISFGRLPNETRLAGKLYVWVALVGDNATQDNMFVDKNGTIMATEDFLMANGLGGELVAGAYESKCYHVMEPSADPWIFDLEPFLKISVKVERLPVDLGREEGVVDVIDLIITKRDMDDIKSSPNRQ